MTSAPVHGRGRKPLTTHAWFARAHQKHPRSSNVSSSAKNRSIISGQWCHIDRKQVSSGPQERPTEFTRAMAKFPELLKHRGGSRLHITSYHSPFKRKTPYQGISMIRTETQFRYRIHQCCPNLDDPASAKRPNLIELLNDQPHSPKFCPAEGFVACGGMHSEMPDTSKFQYECISTNWLAQEGMPS